MPSKKIILFLIIIVVFGSFLRFYSLGSTELIHDEGLDIFRSIGYLDYLDSAAQSTPIQWLFDKPLPWWTNLSFHDDPPLFFIIQHTFINIFGENLFAARLPSALAGIGSIILIFFIVRRFLNSDFAGFVASFVLSINFAHIWISRIAILESTVIFFVLLNIYFFLRFISFGSPTFFRKSDSQINWLLFGVTLGLCFLTKYTSIFIIPVYVVYLLIFNRAIFKKQNLYLAFIIASIIFSPVIVYNIYLYQTFGHFDLQIATLLRQNVSYWQGESGKTQEPFSNIAENLMSIYSLPILLFVILGIFVSCTLLIIKNKFIYEINHILIFILSLFVFITFLLVFIGSAIRFVVFYSIPITMITVVLFMMARIFVDKYKQTWIKHTFVIVFAGFLAYEGMFTISAMRSVYASDFGVMAIDGYFDSTFKNERPSGLLQHENPHLNKIIQKYASGYPNTLAPSGIIYDDNIELPHRLWLISRREFYHGIPIMPASEFLGIIQKEGAGQFAGFTLFFVKADIGAPVRITNQLPQAGQIEALLKNNLKLSPDAIFNDDSGNPAFRVYKFSFQ
ncbi:MAG: glycosyltransferase family 39 protein [Patescibacteria group bacterium]